MFSRLVHIVSLPLNYLARPWQRVIRTVPEMCVYRASSDDVLERVP